MTVNALHPQLARALTDLPAAYLAVLARDAHRAQCRGCRTEQCPTGQHLENAARPNSDLATYPAL